MKDPDSFGHTFESDFLSLNASTGVPHQPSPYCCFLPLLFGCSFDIMLMLMRFLPVPSCDTPKVQLSLANIYGTSTVFQALCYALGEKQRLLGYSPTFKEFIDSELVIK